MLDSQLVLQIFPRHQPHRAVTYSGDEELIQRILRDLGSRLDHDATSTADPLRLVDSDRDRDRGLILPEGREEVVEEVIQEVFDAAGSLPSVDAVKAPMSASDAVMVWIGRVAGLATKHLDCGDSPFESPAEVAVFAQAVIGEMQHRLWTGPVSYLFENFGVEGWLLDLVSGGFANGSQADGEAFRFLTKRALEGFYLARRGEEKAVR